MSVQIVEVKTKKEQRSFVNFPCELYQENPCFIPPLYGDEMKMFRKNFVYADTCENVFFLAYDGKEVVGRIMGILQKASNEKHHEKKVRFSHFDAINSLEVAKALFSAVENWAREKNMEAVCGPLGFSDLEREGLLIEGFEEPSTFEEQYNAPYYQKLIETCGYQKEVDWFESQLRAPEVLDPQIQKTADFVMKRYHLHLSKAKNTREFLKKYADDFFHIVDVSYDDIYGTVPFTDGMKKMMIDNFKLIIDMKYVALILDEQERPVCFGICFPGFGKALQKSKGHLYPWTIVRLLMEIKHPKKLDLGLVGVMPEYKNRGLSVVIANELIRMLQMPEIAYADTNLNLEDNDAIRHLWKRFDQFENKKRRAYIKDIQGEESLV